jgi:energy-coupling factor transporter ATP-binding protein EcfA2
MRDNPNKVSDLVDDLNAVIKKLPALDKATVTLNTPELRDRIADARNLYGMQTSTEKQNRSLSAELVKKLAIAAAAAAAAEQ